jgi:hypothetical protein
VRKIGSVRTGEVSPQKRARAAFGSAVILLLLSGGIAYVAISRLLTAQQWVTHTHEVQAALADVNIVLGRARRAQIEYIEVGIRLTHQTPMPSMRKWKTILGT